MKKYNVNVNGTLYEVEIEELNEVPKSADTKTTVSAPVSAPAPEAPASGETILAPMPGNILDVQVSAGSIVKAGDILMILEAMKMENEILCPRDGKVASVAVTKGQTVDTGALLCVIE